MLLFSSNQQKMACVRMLVFLLVVFIVGCRSNSTPFNQEKHLAEPETACHTLIVFFSELQSGNYDKAV